MTRSSSFEAIQGLILAYFVTSGLCATFDEAVHICTRKGSCRCENKYANCEDQRLQTANLTVDDGTVIQHLNLRNNMIRSLVRGAILPGQEKFLKVLDFRQNFISEISNQAFMGMTNLQDLLLTQNKISSLRQSMFDNLDFNLVNLDLSNNVLKTFRGPVFSGLSSLRYLNLNDNPIDSFDNETFEGLYELVELTVDNALLTCVEESTFLSLRKVQLLSFRHNRFETVPVFRGLSSLRKLDLSENPIHVVPSHALKWVPNLQHLNLKFMPTLTRVDDCAFCGLHTLKQLLMYGCPQLIYINTFAFGPSQYFRDEIVVVDLSNNSLTTLDMHLLPWRNVSSIKLFDNPWICDCNLRWMIDLSLKFQGKPIMCAAPDNARNRPVLDLKPETLKCKRVLTDRARLFIIVAILALSCSLFMVVWMMFCSKTWNKRWLSTIFRSRKMPRLYVYRNLAMKEEVDCDQLVDRKVSDESIEPDMVPEPGSIIACDDLSKKQP